MIKSRKFKRVLTVISVLALIICFAQTAVFAENTVSITDSGYSNNTITVTASISGAAGAEMTMLAVITNDPELELSSYDTPDALADDVQYIDQVTAESYTWEFELRAENPEDYDYVVVFVSGTDASVQKVAIPLTEPVVYKENGTVTFADGTDFVGSAPTFTVAGGDDEWAGQLAYAVTDAEGNAVDATVDVAAGTITMEAPFEETTYTVTFTNSGDDFDPAFSAEKTFTLISEEGAAAAAAIEELNALPGNLGVSVDAGDDAYTITIPENTENITYTVTVDGEEVADRPVVVDRADEDGDAKAVVVTAAANGTDSTKTRTINVPAKGVVGPQIAEDDVTIIDNKGKGVYSPYLGNDSDNVIVTIAAGEIDAATQNVKVDGTDFFYVEKLDYFVGIVPRAEKADIIAAVEIGDGASDVVVYGRDPERLDKAIGNPDYIAVKKLVLKKFEAPDDTAMFHKKLLSADIGGGKMDGQFTNPDYIAVKRVVLKKDADFPINNP